MRKVLFIILIFFANMVFAECVVSSGGILDNLVLTFCKSLYRWGEESTYWANKIFMILFTMEFLWQLTVKKIFVGDLERLWVFFFTRIALSLFFAKYLINVDFYKHLIEFFVLYGAKIGGLKVDIDVSNNTLFAGISPSSMISYFSCTVDALHHSTDSTSILGFITIKIVLAITEVIFFIIMILISYLLMEVYIKTYFLLYVGFILAGFAGSSWTINFWQKYLQQIAAMALEFLTICVLLGVLSDQCRNWVMMIANANSDAYELSRAFFNIVGISLIFAKLIEKLPAWVSGKLAGEIRLHLDDTLKGVSGFMAGKY